MLAAVRPPFPVCGWRVGEVELWQKGGQLPPPHKQLQRRRLGHRIVAAKAILASYWPGIDERVANHTEVEDVVHNGAETLPAGRQGCQLHKRRRFGPFGGGARDADNADGVHAGADKLLLVEVGVVQLAAKPEVVGSVEHVSGIQEEGSLSSTAQFNMKKKNLKFN